MLKLIIAAALLLHGLGHGGALGALLWIQARPADNTGAWHAAQSWALPSLSPSTALLVASGFWVVALLGFVLAALGFWGVWVPADAWRPIAVAAAVVSLVGIVLFFGTWPLFNTIAALAMNVAVLVAILWAHWPPASVVEG